MGRIVLEDATKSFGDTQVIPPLNLTIEDGEFAVFVGPSGCGKSTTLRMIAGLESVSDGEIYIDGKPVSHLEPKARDLAMVFQDYALFPHLTIWENVCFGLRKKTNGERKKVALNMLELVGLEQYQKRYPHELSGGQQQRVALARALAPEPSLILLDEPFSNLDVDLRRRLSLEVRDILKAQGTTALLVTHDQEEALTMSDRIAVMIGGEILQCDAPSVTYEDPSDIRVAEFIGSPKINILPVELSDAKLTLFDRVLGHTTEAMQTGFYQLGLRPEALKLTQAEPVMTGTVAHMENLGSEVYAQIALADQTARATLRAAPAERHKLQLGAKVGLGFGLKDAMLFDGDGKRQRRLEIAFDQAREVA